MTQLVGLHRDLCERVFMSRFWTIRFATLTKTRNYASRDACARITAEAGSRTVRKKKPVDPIRQAEKNRAHRVGWVIALAGIAVGFALVLAKQI